jgi:hypothetical protein
MRLLRNQAEFEEWKDRNIFDGDEAGQPREFPCYVRLLVKDWHMEYCVHNRTRVTRER